MGRVARLCHRVHAHASESLVRLVVTVGIGMVHGTPAAGERLAPRRVVRSRRNNGAFVFFVPYGTATRTNNHPPQHDIKRRQSVKGRAPSTPMTRQRFHRPALGRGLVAYRTLVPPAAPSRRCARCLGPTRAPSSTLRMALRYLMDPGLSGPTNSLANSSSCD